MVWEKVAELVLKRESLISQLETFERGASDPRRFFAKGSKRSSVTRLEEAKIRSSIYKVIVWLRRTQPETPLWGGQTKNFWPSAAVRWDALMESCMCGRHCRGGPPVCLAKCSCKPGQPCWYASLSLAFWKILDSPPSNYLISITRCTYRVTFIRREAFILTSVTGL